MALSPAHALGQVIGELLEKAIQPSLQKVADDFGMYLDYKHPRPTRLGRAGQGKSLVSWVDGKNNKHDLDFVLEQGGSETVVGRPQAFIEIAWRRYTMHSKNKAQEIEGAIGHLNTKYHDCHPFLGAVLAGEFTAPSITQLESHGFTVLYFKYANVIAAFAKLGIDASYDEDTADDDVQAELDKYKALTQPQRDQISAELHKLQKSDIEAYMDSLRITLSRAVEAVFVIPLHGSGTELASVDDAIQFINDYAEDVAPSEFVRYEVIVRYTNGSKIEGSFGSKADTVDFLNRMV